jgi:S-methylmethionine-dependent homocysteine/selenocysteine methylase
MTRIALLLSLAFSMLTIVPAVGADKFECPSSFKPNTAAKLEQIKGLLPSTSAMSDINQLNATIAALRRDGMSKRLIIDHLIGAYCPMVAQEASSTAAEKAALVRRFSGQVTRLVYSLESGLDIIINVPLTPDIVDAVNDIAKKQGLSGPAWIAMTIDDALQQQSAARRQ